MPKTKDIMTTDVVIIQGSATVAEAIALMKEKKLQGVIVDRLSEGDAYGIITETDIVSRVIAQRKAPDSVQVQEIMTKPCIVVNPDLDVKYVAQLFANSGVRRAPVIKGELLGIISTTDIIRKAT